MAPMQSLTLQSHLYSPTFIVPLSKRPDISKVVCSSIGSDGRFNSRPSISQLAIPSVSLHPNPFPQLPSIGTRPVISRPTISAISSVVSSNPLPLELQRFVAVSRPKP